MANKKLKRRHHTVPRSHLARFAHDGQMTRVELPGDKRHPISICDATVERDFYLITRGDGSRSDELEDHFGRIEDLAAQSVREIVDRGTWPISTEARANIAAWAALQYLRTQTQRQVSHEIADAGFKMLIAAGGKDQIRQSIEYADGRPATNEDVDQAWDRLTAFDNYVITPENGLHLKALGNLLEPTTGQFFDSSWQLIRFTRKALVTTDAPVVLLPRPASTPSRRVGLAKAGGVVVPLDRRVGLLMTLTGGPDEVLPGTTAWAKQLNQWLAYAARRAIYHHPDDNPLDGIELPEPRGRELHIEAPTGLLPHPVDDMNSAPQE
jgi:hypothetical protein